MIVKAYSIFDVKADVFHAPFFTGTHGLAIRNFKDVANDKNSSIGKYPADFKLVCIGSYDDSRGVMEPLEHESLGFATEFVERDERQMPLRGVS